ncbi:hypothetical protein ACFSC6_18170 [Rufibacter sediminis]|uniref:Uncharacterized protein n=1 Tax=Rufibacter sediminis TaxID=2762756 RepID=A0ABR6VS81_9BACT|nr:hypothetical protein [Rufibacter sediminis]MBC3539451.1 hypothetical protein [Rufibacter sediminis]
MSKLFYYGTVVSALVPSTYLFIISLFIVFSLVESFPLNLQGSVLLTQSLLGLFGYFGLLMLLIENTGERRKMVLIFLAMGVASFLVSIGFSGQKALNWLASMKEPGELFVLVWPVSISIFYIVRIAKRLPTYPINE